MCSSSENTSMLLAPYETYEDECVDGECVDIVHGVSRSQKAQKAMMFFRVYRVILSRFPKKISGVLTFLFIFIYHLRTGLLNFL